MEEKEITFLKAAHNLLKGKVRESVRIDVPFGVDRPIFIEEGFGTSFSDRFGYSKADTGNFIRYETIYDIGMKTITDTRQCYSQWMWLGTVSYEGSRGPVRDRFDTFEKIAEEARKTLDQH